MPGKMKTAKNPKSAKGTRKQSSSRATPGQKRPASQIRSASPTSTDEEEDDLTRDGKLTLSKYHYAWYI